MALGHDQVLMEVEGPEYDSGRPSPAQAPIGTDRPHSSAGVSIDRRSSLKLNPTAKDFTSIFTNLRGSTSEEKATTKAKASEEKASAKAKASEEKASAKAKAEEQREQRKAEAKERRDRKKAEKAEKNAEKSKKGKSKDDKEKDSERFSVDTPHLEGKDFFAFANLGASPANSRKSRDTPSISTTDASIRESRESLERTVSRTPSENFLMTPVGVVKTKDGDKETFMQKLTRKSSSNMFNFTTFSNKPGSLFSSRNNTPKMSASEFTDEAEEDSGLGSSVGDLSEARKEKEKEREKEKEKDKEKDKDKDKLNKSGHLSWGGLGLRKMSKKEKSLHETESVSGDEIGLGLHG